VPKFKLHEQEPVSSIEVLLAKIKEMRRQAIDQNLGGVWYFRGDTDPDLKPHLGRPRKFGGKTITLSADQERKLLNRFRRFAYSEFNRVATEWEALFLARHYDLPTRIMDWSVSPLVALYFACSPRQEVLKSGIVWGILRLKNDTDDLNIFKKEAPLDLYKNDPDPRAIKLVYPVYNSGRIVAQKGIFTWHSDPYTPVEKQAGQDFADKKLDIEWLVKWPIVFDPLAMRTQIIQELEQLGISSRTIFPDLNGITAGLWQTEVLFS
jgi:hypothetical protein